MLSIIVSKTTLCLFLSLICGVFGATDEVNSVSVTEGDSVTLNTDVTEVQSKDQILWSFGPQETRIAELYKHITDMFDSSEIFGDRLNIDSQTGSLTITDIRNEHSGRYKLEIMSKSKSSKRFNVTVYAPLPAPVISKMNLNSSSSDSRCSVLCSVLNLRAVSLSWYKGNSLINRISVSNLSVSPSLPMVVEYQDKNTYSCVINNKITNRTTYLDINQLCETNTNKEISHAAIFHPGFISALVLPGLAAAMYFL